MRLINYRKPVLWTSLAWIGLLGSCASTELIKTWGVGAANVRPDCQLEKPLIRTNDAGVIQEALTVLQANAYRCYSPVDDEAWRTRMVQLESCCNTATIQ